MWLRVEFHNLLFNLHLTMLVELGLRIALRFSKEGVVITPIPSKTMLLMPSIATTKRTLFLLVVILEALPL